MIVVMEMSCGKTLSEAPQSEHEAVPCAPWAVEARLEPVAVSAHGERQRKEREGLLAYRCAHGKSL